MLNGTKKHIDAARDILVGKIPDPKTQVEQITTALIYKFMDDMDKESEELGGKSGIFANGYEKYSWSKLLDNRLSGQDRLNLYVEAITQMSKNPNLPQLFRDIFKDTFLPYRDPETLNLFLKEINEFKYDHSENLGDAYEYLLSILGSQGDAGQFRTPRHIIDFIVKVVDPKKEDTILDPACGTAGFLISAYKHILKNNDGNDNVTVKPTKSEKYLTPDEKEKLMNNFVGYDISPDMVRLSLVNMYLHGFSKPKIFEYDTLTSDERWDDEFDVIMANPPFMTPKGGVRPHKKFSIQANRTEVLFVDYFIEHLKRNGRAGIIVPEGIIFQSSNAYKNLRKMLVDDGLYAVVSLPSGVFQPYSGVKTSILLFNNEFAKQTKEILFVKVDNDGFDLGAQRKSSTKNDLPEALKIIRNWQKGEKVESKLANFVEKAKIVENGYYNLSGDRYKETVNYSNTKYEIVELSEIAEVIAGQSPEGQYYNTENKGIPFYQGKTEFTEKYIGTPNKWTTKVTKIAEKGDILMSVRAPVGPVNFACEKICIGRGLASIRVVKANPNYVFYILRNIEKQIKGNGGAVFDSINKADIEKIKIPLPPLEVQEQIVAELDGYQKIIDGAKMVVENWKPRIVEDPEWEEKRIGDAFTIESGGTPGSNEPSFWNGEIKWATLVDIPKSIETITNTQRTISKLGLKNSSAKLLPIGTILVSTRATIGRIAIAGVEITTNQGFKNILVDEANDSKFIAYVLFARVAEMESLASGGTFKEISKSNFASIKIPLPALNIQKQVIETIENEKGIIDSNQKIIEIYTKKIQIKIKGVWGE